MLDAICWRPRLGRVRSQPRSLPLSLSLSLSLSHFTHSLFSLPLSPLSSSGSGWSLSSVQSLRAPLTSWAGFFADLLVVVHGRRRNEKMSSRQELFFYILSPPSAGELNSPSVFYSPGIGFFTSHEGEEVWVEGWGGVVGGCVIAPSPPPSLYSPTAITTHQHPHWREREGGGQRASFPASMKHPEPSHKEKKKKKNGSGIQSV